MRFSVLVTLAALLVVGLVACGSEEPATSSDEDDTAETTSDAGSEGSSEASGEGSGTDGHGHDSADHGHGSDDPGSTASSGSTADDAGPGLVGEPRTRQVESDDFPGGGGARRASLVDVRVGAHDGFDRVVLEFDGQDVPSYRVGYVDPPVRQDGSGNEVDVAGDAFLELRVTPASGRTAQGEVTYEGPRRVPAGDAAVVTEVVRTGDFEANLAWVAGVDRRRPFAVAFLTDPLRLVVDVVAD